MIIQLKSRGKVVGSAVISDEDSGIVSGYKWRLRKTPRSMYARTSVKTKSGEWRDVLMHRLILGIGDDSMVDHANGNGLDNRRDNLRIASHSQNAMNKRKAGGTSRFKGVLLSSAGTWQANIWINGRSVYLGRHRSEEAAALAYDRAALSSFGEFAKTNFSHEIQAY